MTGREAGKWLGAAVLAAGVAVLVLQACSGGGGGSGPAASSAGSAGPGSGATVRRTLDVPATLAQAPFDDSKSLMVPPGFGIRLWARVQKARFMALAPNGDLLVSVPDQGKVVLLRERANDAPQQFDFATGMSKPHDMVFHNSGGTLWLYIAESNRVTRSPYQPGETASAPRSVVVDGLPDASTPELGGTYGHELKNIALGPDDKLYVAIGSSCNACESDANSEPLRAAVHQYNADGTAGRLFARGLRNAEGLDFLPGTNTLWVTVNERDDLVYPFHADADGDGEDDYGRVIPSYVDDHPPDLFTPLRDGGNYGWPYCHPEPNAAMSQLPLMRDVQFNSDGSKLDCAAVDKAAKGIAAHSAPLGFSFLHDSNVPVAYRNGAVLALHGCWNCTTLRGYKVSYLPVDGAGNAGAEVDLVSGFLTDAQARTYWGRPVDAIPDGRGGLFISDDYAGAIYQLYPLQP